MDMNMDRLAALLTDQRNNPMSKVTQLIVDELDKIVDSGTSKADAVEVYLFSRGVDFKQLDYYAQTSALGLILNRLPESLEALSPAQTNDLFELLRRNAQQAWMNGYHMGRNA